MFKISSKEAKWLTKNGVRWNDNGVSHTTARHRRTYYLCESERNLAKHREFLKMENSGKTGDK